MLFFVTLVYFINMPEESKTDIVLTVALVTQKNFKDQHETWTACLS